MPTTSNAPSTKPLPRAFWFYLLGVHSVYALTLTQHFTHLEAPELDLRWLSFAEFATLLDLVLLPALVYAFLTRRQPKQALFGALGMMMLGLLAVRIWFPQARMGAGLQWALDARSMLMPVLWGVAIALEVYVLSQLLRFLLKPMKEGAVSVMIEPIAMSLGRDHWLCRWVAAETRIWIYALSKKLPSFEDFEGDQHFGYAQQNANASTWLGMTIANLVPTPLLHFILDRIHWGLAWSTTAITLMSSLWMWAEYRATQARPISLSADKLLLRYGTLVDREIELAQIVSYRTLSWREIDAKHSRTARPKSYVGMGGPNVELTLSNGETVWLGIDQPSTFLAALDRRCNLGRSADV